MSSPSIIQETSTDSDSDSVVVSMDLDKKTSELISHDEDKFSIY